MKKSTATLVLSALAFAATTACAAEPVIGLITKTETNPFFVKMKEGAQAEAKKLGAKLLTAAGKQDGDNAGQITAIENMIAAGAKTIMITPNDSKAIIPSIKKAQAQGVMFIALDSPTDPVEGTDALFATDNYKAGVLIGQYAKAAMAGKPAKIAIAWENTSHGKDFDKGIKDFSAAHPGSFDIGVDESFALDGKDFSAILSKVKAAKPDIFMADAHLPDFLTMQRQYVTAGLCSKILTYGARGSEKDAKEALGAKNVSYILSAVWWNAQVQDDKGLNKAFVEAFTAKYGTKPEWYQAVGYETARALFTAMTEAGSVDKTKVRDALAALEMDSLLPGGTLSFPADKGGQASYPFVVQQNQPDGTSPIVYPADYATAEGTAPNPGCKA